MPHATAADVAALLARELDTAETALVTRRLDQVERMILRRIPDLEAQITAGTIDAQDVADVEAEAVLRVVRNPDGIVAEGDGQYTYTKSREAADNRLRITNEEWSLLGVRAGRMFQISPGIGGLAL